MDSIVDSLQNAYKDFRTASDEVLKSKEQSGGLKSTALDAALENFRQKGELLRVACDQTEEFVDSMRQRIGLECLVDEATGSIKPAGTTSLPPISAVRLEQMSKAVRWLVIELQNRSGGAASA